MEPPSHEDARDQASPNGVLELLAPLEADSLEACVEIEAMLASIKSFHESFGAASDDAREAGSGAGAESTPRRRRRRVPVDLTAIEAETAAHQVQPKTPDTRTRLVDALRKRFPFSVLHLGEGDVEDLVDVMECEQVADGEAVPSKGGHFFVLLEGRLVDAASGAELLPGSAFGEVALLYDAPAPKQVARGACVLWSLRRSLFRRVLRATAMRKVSELIAFLSKVDLLKPLGSVALQRVARALRPRSFTDGEYIIRQFEEAAEEFFLIESGCVRCTDAGDAGQHGERLLVRLSRGEFFGERALMQNEPRKANAIAEGNVSCYVLARAQFARLLGGQLQLVLERRMTARVLDSVLAAHAAPARAALMESFRIEHYSYGALVCAGSSGPAGEPRFFVVRDGELEDTSVGRSLRTGECFGEGAVVDGGGVGEVAVGSVVVKSARAELLVITRADFGRIVATHAHDSEGPGDDARPGGRESGSEAETHPQAEATRTTLSLRDDAIAQARARIQRIDPSEFETLGPLRAGGLHGIDVELAQWCGPFAEGTNQQYLTLKRSSRKQLRRAGAAGVHAARSLQTEALALAAMQGQPYIIQLLGIGAGPQHECFLALELITTGVDLWTVLYGDGDGGPPKAALGAHGGVSEELAVLYTACLAQALAHVHQEGWVCRDVKPESVLLTERGLPKVAEFSIAKNLGGGARAQSGAAGSSEGLAFTMCGTAEYMAPELVLGSGHEHAVDCWALGVLVFELLFRTTPFRVPEQVDDHVRLFERIVRPQQHLRFPPDTPVHTKSIIRAFLHPNAALRLSLEGALDTDTARTGEQTPGIQDQPFFSQPPLASCGWERIARQEVSSPYTPRSEGPFGAQFSRVEENAPAPRHSEQHPGSAAAIDELLTLFDSGTGPPQGPS